MRSFMSFAVYHRSYSKSSLFIPPTYTTPFYMHHGEDWDHLVFPQLPTCLYSSTASLFSEGDAHLLFSANLSFGLLLHPSLLSYYWLLALPPQLFILKIYKYRKFGRIVKWYNIYTYHLDWIIFNTLPFVYVCICFYCICIDI